MAAHPAVTSSDHFRWRVFVAMLAATIASFVTFWVLVPPTYLTNDDVAIRRDLEGLTAPGASPTGYVLMAHSALGWALVWLSPLLPAHSWDFVVAALLIVSVAVLLTHGWSFGRDHVSRLLSVTAVMAAVAPSLAGMQFTISATLAGIAGMTTAARELLLAGCRRNVVVASTALVMAGLLVRPMGATAGALLVIVLLTPITVWDRELRTMRIRRLFMGALLLVVTALALLYVDEALYGLSPAWSAYHRDNWILAQLFEWGGDVPASTSRSLLASVGWSANDWEVLRRFWGVDQDRYSNQRIETLYHAWTMAVSWRDRAVWLMHRTAAEATPATVARLCLESTAALSIAVVLAVASASRRALIAAATSIGLFYAVCMGIEIGFKELPERLLLPLQVGLVVAVLATSRALTRGAATSLTVLCAGLMVTLGVYEFGLVASQAMADNRQSKETDAQVVDLLQSHPSLVLMHADSFPSEHWWRPFHTPPTQLRAIQLGMNNHNPYVQRFVARYAGASLLHAICTDPSILVVADRGRLDPVTTFMKEHDGTDVDWIEVYAGSFHAWQCSSRKTN